MRHHLILLLHYVRRQEGEEVGEVSERGVVGALQAVLPS